MIKRFLLSCFYSFLVISVSLALQAQTLEMFDTLTFSQVAQGRFGATVFETTLIVVNPNSESADVQISANGLEPERISFALRPGELRQVRFSGENPRTGSVSIQSKPVVTAVADIAIKAEDRLIPVVTIPAQKRALRAATVVFRNAVAADDTGVAITFHGAGRFRLILRDEGGTEISRRELVSPAFCIVPPPPRTPEQDIIKDGRIALMLAELFPNLPPTFTQGHILMEFEGDHPSAFTVQSLYLKGTELRLAPVQALSKDVEFVVQLPQGADVEATAKELASNFGLIVKRISLNSTSFTTQTTPELAKLLARNPKVKFVEPNNLICFFP